MKVQTKEDKALLEFYTEVYKQSTPSADFTELVNNAPINEYGQKVIDFMSYSIDIETFYTILYDIIKKYKFNKNIGKRLETTVLLGCSPKFS